MGSLCPQANLSSTLAGQHAGLLLFFYMLMSVTECSSRGCALHGVFVNFGQQLHLCMLVQFCSGLSCRNLAKFCHAFVNVSAETCFATNGDAIVNINHVEIFRNGRPEP